MAHRRRSRLGKTRVGRSCLDWQAKTSHAWPMYGRRVDPAMLVRLVAERGWSLAELARQSGVSYSLIRYVKDGVCQFSDVTAHKIATALGCKPEDFSVPDPTRTGRARAS